MMAPPDADVGVLAAAVSGDEVRVVRADGLESAAVESEPGFLIGPHFAVGDADGGRFEVAAVEVDGEGGTGIDRAIHAVGGGDGATGNHQAAPVGAGRSGDDAAGGEGAAGDIQIGAADRGVAVISA